MFSPQQSWSWSWSWNLTEHDACALGPSVKSPQVAQFYKALIMLLQ